MSLAKTATYLYNNKLYKAINKALRIQYEEIDKIEAIQEIKFERLIDHAKKNVVYYEDKLEGVYTIKDLSKIPFLTKKEIRNNFKKLKSKNIDSKRFIKNSTSGSTGESLKFYSDLDNNYRKAVNIRGDN